MYIVLSILVVAILLLLVYTYRKKLFNSESRNSAPDKCETDAKQERACDCDARTEMVSQINELYKKIMSRKNCEATSEDNSLE
jgi:hypothetical protein